MELSFVGITVKTFGAASKNFPNVVISPSTCLCKILYGKPRVLLGPSNL